MSTPCVAERYCKCGAQLQIEYAVEGGADSAVAALFDELHDGPDCGPVSPQAAAIARSRMSRRELRHRQVPDTGKGETMTEDEEYPLLPRDAYEMTFPDYTGIRDRVIDGVLTALRVPAGTRGSLRARDAWVEIDDDGNAQIRLVCHLGGWNRSTHHGAVELLRNLPEHRGNYDETFNPAYASFCFALPETLSPEVRAEMASKSEGVRDLAAEAKTKTGIVA